MGVSSALLTFSAITFEDQIRASLIMNLGDTTIGLVIVVAAALATHVALNARSRSIINHHITSTTPQTSNAMVNTRKRTRDNSSTTLTLDKP